MSRLGAQIFKYSLPLDVHRNSDSPEAASAIEHLLGQLIALRRSRGQRIRDASAIRSHLKAVVFDLYIAYLQPPFVYRGLARTPSAYSDTESRYKRLYLSYRHTTSVVDDLVTLGYVKQWKGFYDRTKHVGRQTRIRARKRLIDTVQIFAVKQEMIGSYSKELIVLKDSDKSLIEYQDNEDTLRMRTTLEKINASIEKRRICLELSPESIVELRQKMSGGDTPTLLDFDAVQLHRVFNNSSFKEGGRFYGGWWQRIPKEYRKYISIDYKDTIEIDYSGMHLRILYGKVGADCPDDPYDLQNFSREHQKLAALILVNADSAEESIKALRERGIPNPIALFEALITRHNPISESFFSGMGVKLQYLDSCIAELVMLKMITLGGIALPVHDSFIVRIGRESELKDAMEEAFRSVVPNIAPALKPKQTLMEKLKLQESEPKLVTDDRRELLKGQKFIG